MSQFWWFSNFPGIADIPVFQQSYFLPHGFEHILFGSALFCCLLLEYLLSVCCISTFKPSYLSSPLLSSTCPSPLHFVGFLKTVFHLINFVSGLWILPLITLIYLLVLQYHFCPWFLSSTASSPFISFWCLIISSLIYSFLVPLLIVVCTFLLCPVLSK